VLLARLNLKSVFYVGLAILVLFEIARVYFVMPMPGSQRIKSVDFAYFLHVYRWWFRVGCGLLLIAGSPAACALWRKWLPAVLTLLPLIVVLLGAGIIWFLNTQMTAESIFQPPQTLAFQPRASSTVDESSLVLAVERNGEAKAYPIRFLVYHHQVQDVVGGEPVFVTYCSVCRTGRVFSPLVHGQVEAFRLVGMDQFNAMFEDATTRSWWRQATGEAVAGARRGEKLTEIPSHQLTARAWFELQPAGLMMQPDAAAKAQYGEGKFERGESTGPLTRTDPESWKDKSWVVGITIDGRSKAYDWNHLKERRIINDQVGETPIVLALAADGQGFVAFARPAAAETFTIEADVLSSAGKSYDLLGRDRADPAQRLATVPAFQEFWHSWRTFQPDTDRYP
jgi:hypothetical protein